MNQEQRVIDYMKSNGSITRADALLHCSIANLTAVISDIRKSHRVDGVYEESVNRYGEKIRFMRYYYHGELGE